MRSKSEVVGTLQSLPQFLESIKNQVLAVDRMPACDLVGTAASMGCALSREPLVALVDLGSR
jgi:hypothetical protein